MSNIILRDVNGVEITYRDVNTLTVRDADSSSGDVISFSNTSDADITSSDVLSGKIGYSFDGLVVGNIPTKTESDITSASGIVTIPLGYYALQYLVEGDPSGDATASENDLLLGKTAYSQGQKLIGTIPMKGSSDITSVGGVVTIPAGYYSLQHTKQGDPSGDATASVTDILYGKTAYSQGLKLTGTIQTKTNSDITTQDAVITIPKGYYALLYTVNPTQDATATADDIKEGVFAYSQGQKAVGSMPIRTDSDITSSQGLITIPKGYYGQLYQVLGDPSGDATATADDILSDKTAYSQGLKLTGTIVIQEDSSNVPLGVGESKSYPAGYYPNAHGATQGIAASNIRVSAGGTLADYNGSIS